MANTTTKGIKTSFANTPQAGDDIYSWSEDQLLLSGVFGSGDATHHNTLTLNVMSNDLGGNAKSLFSIDDGNGHTNLTDYDLLNADTNGVWENTSTAGDQIRIYNGQIQLDISGALSALGATDVNSLAAGDHIHEDFDYAIRLANGTLSQARVTVDIQGQNDAATISGDTSSGLTEDSTDPATGTFTVVDPDHGQSHTQTATNAATTNGLGTYSVDADGHWSYTVNNAAVQHLTASATATDSFTVTSLDGTAHQDVTITIQGENDPASIGGNAAGSLTEDDVTAATGTLVVSDVDDGEAHTAAASGTTALGSSWSIDADGNWSYTLNNAAVQHLSATESTSDTFTVSSQDGTAHQDVTIAIQGENDPASFVPGGNSASMTEDDVTAAAGVLAVSDVDDGEGHTAAASGTTALGSSWSIDAAGNWSYTLDNAAVQHLSATESTTDTFTVFSQDGTAHQDVTITIQGENDAASISGNAAGSLTEDDVTPASGMLVVSDVDDGEAHTAAASGTTALGSSWSIDDAGNWSYTLNNAAVQNLNVGDSVIDSFTVDSADGTAQQPVNITINGLNDPATITGTTNGTVVEAGAGNGGGTPTATGTLHDTDVDNTPNTFQAVTTATASDNGFGTFTVDSHGHWTYALDNSNSTVDALNTGDSLTDTFTVQTQDGTAQQIAITINGAGDDLGAPTGIAFTLNAGANNASNLGTFTETGDPDGNNDVYTWSVGAGSSGGFNVTGGTLNANGIATGVDNTLNLVVTDQAGHTATSTYHVFVGTNGGDTFSFAALGDNGSNIADGLNGGDTITGGSGTDYLLGGGAADTLIGGGGADQLAGQGGDDIFKFTATTDSTAASHDTILDYNTRNNANTSGDRIDVSAIDANVSPGFQHFTFDAAQNQSAVAGHITWYQDAVHNETVVQAAVAGDGVLEAHLTGLLTLHSQDFIV